MLNSTQTFFPPRSNRVMLEFVVGDFPFPLALTYARLHDEMDRQEPIAAAWQLRDAFECLLKFTACLAVADFLNAKPDRAQASNLVGLLMKPQGLSLGDWHTLLELALQGSTGAERCLPNLFGVFFQPNGRRTALNRKVDGDANSFVNWRNRVFGHGVFKQERQWYAEQTLSWLPTLNEFYQALYPILNSWVLISITPNGEEIIWQGAGDLPYVARHPHEPLGEPLPMFLSRPHKKLPLSPLLSVQVCAVCQQPATFFFDRHRYEHEKDRHRTFFIEYFRGHEGEHINWKEAKRLTQLLPEGFKWERISYDAVEAIEGVRIVFREFETEYIRPDYLMDAFWRVVDERRKGYIHLIAPGGIGKTYFVRGLEQEGSQRGIPVLAYYIVEGPLTDYRVFIIELAENAREKLRFRTQEAQTKVASFSELQEQFSEFLNELKRANRLDTLIVAIDGLDVLPDPEPHSAAITDFLPPPDKLPDGCFILLTSRETLRPRIREDLERLRVGGKEKGGKGDLEFFVTFEVRPDDQPNQHLVRAYLSQRLPEPFRTPHHVEEVLRRCGGVFLYAFHFCRALEAGVFTDVSALPEGSEFYPAYLARLKERVGEDLFETVYLPTLLFLSAAQQPVSLTQLARWGIPRERLQFALLDLNDFLRAHRIRRWHESLSDEPGEPRYEIAHEAFLRFVQGEPQLSEKLRDAHATIARYAMTSHAGWEEFDPSDDSDLYHLRFVLSHLQQAGLTDIETAVVGDEGYAEACLSAGNTCYDKARYHLAADLYECALRVYQHLVKEEGRVELENYLAMALVNKGNALQDWGRLMEAISCFDDAIVRYRRLVEEGRVELENDLAGALMNKGVALGRLGRLTEAISCYDDAIVRYRRLVEEGGRVELENHLAMALMNKGVALGRLGHLTEAISCYDDAIARYRRLVEEGRVELENDLAGALMNKGLALEQLQRWKEALNCYSEGIELWERLVEGGMTHVTPNLIKSLKIRFDLLRQLGVWEVAATDVVRALSYAASLLEKESASESVMQELMGFLQRLRMLSEQERAQLYSALGKWGEVVRRLIES